MQTYDVVHLDRQINRLYVGCSDLRAQVLSMRNSIHEVKDISVNTSIAASQTGSHVHVFSELAIQIEKTSKKMTREAQEVLEQINQMTRQTLRAVTLNQRIPKYRLALRRISTPENQELVIAAILGNELEIKQCIHSVDVVSKGVDATLRSFRDLINRLYIALTSIRIEADVFHEQTELAGVSALSNSLEKTLENLSLEYEALRTQLKSFQRDAYTDSDLKEMHEKRSAA